MGEGVVCGRGIPPESRSAGCPGESRARDVAAGKCWREEEKRLVLRKMGMHAPCDRDLRDQSEEKCLRETPAPL